MSKTFRSFLLVFAASVLILQLFNNSIAQDIDTRIKIDSQTGSTVSVSGRNALGRRNLSFLLSAAGVDKLGERISDVNLFDEAGKAVTYKRFIPGEYVADADFTSWTYKIDLTPSKNQTAAAHVSWMAEKRGILMLDDMLPQFSAKDKRISASVKVDLPLGWKAVSGSRTTKGNDFEFRDVEKAVIFIGLGILDLPVESNGGTLHFVFEDPPIFDYNEAGQLVAGIFNQYRILFDSSVGGEGYIALIKFPVPTALGEWEAETRGRTITIISADATFRSQFMQRLHEQLRHEIFHLWIPNGVNLSGNYDWFYEGFALYQSLKLGVAVNRIRFDDMLDTLSRAYNIDAAGGGRMSLIDASKNRWNGANTQVYARGMLVAFLCDLALLERSKGKFSTDDLLRKFFADYSGPNAGGDGNAAIIAAFNKHAELSPMVDRYINGAEAIDWELLLSGAGLEAVKTGSVTNLAVKQKLTGRQKDLLDKLGYNNWRKLGVK